MHISAAPSEPIITCQNVVDVPNIFKRANVARRRRRGRADAAEIFYVVVARRRARRRAFFDGRTSVTPSDTRDVRVPGLTWAHWLTWADMYGQRGT